MTDTPPARRTSGRALALLLVACVGLRADSPLEARVSRRVPLHEMTGRYKGEDGGLYGKGRNEPPEEHARLAARMAWRIRPLDVAGRPSSRGKIGLLAIGQSTTWQEFAYFQDLMARDRTKSAAVVLVNGGQDSAVAELWSSWFHPWEVARQRLAASGLSPWQVQVVWIKCTHAYPWRYGDYPAHARRYEAMLRQMVLTAKQQFPNLRIAYLSSRVYSGYAGPERAIREPYAYEEAFAIRRLILAQARGDRGLNADPRRGRVRAPVLLWGPYVWADGLRPRDSDGLYWSPADFYDGVHPSLSGRQKVAVYLRRFLREDQSSRPWFLAPRYR